MKEEEKKNRQMSLPQYQERNTPLLVTEKTSRPKKKKKSVIIFKIKTTHLTNNPIDKCRTLHSQIVECVFFLIAHDIVAKYGTRCNSQHISRHRNHAECIVEQQ